MGRNYLQGRDGDRANAVLAAAGDHFSLLLRWWKALLLVLFARLWRGLFSPSPKSVPAGVSSRPTDDESHEQ